MAKVMDDGLKQRLIGAIVLLAIAVIFIPVLFDRNTLTPVDTTSQVPPMPQISIEPIPVAEPPVVASPAPLPEQMFIPPEPELSNTSATDVADDLGNANTVVEETQESVKKAVHNQAPSAPSLNSAGVPNGWLLQVISYTEENKANSFRDELIAKNYPAYVRKTSTSKGVHFRVYIGPKLDRAEIVKIKGEVDKAFKLNTWVVNITPDA